MLFPFIILPTLGCTEYCPCVHYFVMFLNDSCCRFDLHFFSVLITFGLGYVNFRMLFNYPLVLYFVRFRLVFGSILICIQELSSNGWSLMLLALFRECKPKTNFSYTLARRSYSQISSPVKFWSLCSGGNRAEFSLILIVLIFLICGCELKMMLFSNY